MSFSTNLPPNLLFLVNINLSRQSFYNNKGRRGVEGRGKKRGSPQSHKKQMPHRMGQDMGNPCPSAIRISAILGFSAQLFRMIRLTAPGLKWPRSPCGTGFIFALSHIQYIARRDRGNPYTKCINKRIKWCKELS